MKELIPQRKVVAGGVAGAVCYVILRVLDEGFGFKAQAEDAVALLTIVTFVAQYLIPNAKVQNASEEVPNA